MIFLADQKSALVDLVGLLGSLLSLIIILILMQLGERSLLYLGFALSASPVLVLVIAYFFAFSGRYAKYKPSLKCVDFSLSKGLMGLGVKFFIIQICVLLIFATSNVIIARLFSPSYVAVYNIVFKYFSVVTLFFNIIMTTLWSAYTEAFVKQDFVWIKRMIRKMILLWVVFCFSSLVMVLVSESVYRIWIGSTIHIPIEVTISMALYVCIINWHYIFASFNNGASKLQIQMMLLLFGGVVYIPLATILSRQVGLAGISIAMILVLIPCGFLSPLQSYKLIHGKARGIWNK